MRHDEKRHPSRCTGGSSNAGAVRLAAVASSDVAVASTADDGATTLQGRLETCFNSAWGGVCNEAFAYSTARVVCRELGFPHAAFSDAELLPNQRVYATQVRGAAQRGVMGGIH